MRKKRIYKPPSLPAGQFYIVWNGKTAFGPFMLADQARTWVENHRQTAYQNGIPNLISLYPPITGEIGTDEKAHECGQGVLI